MSEEQRKNTGMGSRSGCGYCQMAGFIWVGEDTRPCPYCKRKESSHDQKESSKENHQKNIKESH